MADGSRGNPVLIPDLVKASGVTFLRECDPYATEDFVAHLKEADQFCRSDEGGVAVIISKHPCIMDREATKKQAHYRVSVNEECTGCKDCIKKFECPALVFDEETEKVFIDQNVCIGCGVCEAVCPAGAIIVEANGGRK
jgi:indolepyruvate ferredoxin oxidoreductase alpha subunit